MKEKDDTMSIDEESVSSSSSIEERIRRSVADRNWGVQLKIALSCRKLAIEGHAQTLAGQVTVRAKDDTVWTNQLLGGFASLTQSTVIRVNDDLDVMEGNGIPNPGMRFHLWVYKARPDINAIVHTHPPYASALAMTGRELAIAHMDAAMFYDDCAYLPEWPGVPLSDVEGKLVSEALGGKRSLLLSNHGLMTTGENLETAVYLAMQFERASRLQLLAESVGNIKPVKDEHASEAHDFLLSDGVVIGQFYSWADRLLKEQPEVED
ncbi:MAG: aldolase [Pseudomonadota bacterium]|nr:aldolase [Pseudomonadota bacterium]